MERHARRLHNILAILGEGFNALAILGEGFNALAIFGRELQRAGHFGRGLQRADHLVRVKSSNPRRINNPLSLSRSNPSVVRARICGRALGGI